MSAVIKKFKKIEKSLKNELRKKEETVQNQAVPTSKPSGEEAPRDLFSGLRGEFQVLCSVFPISFPPLLLEAPFILWVWSRRLYRVREGTEAAGQTGVVGRGKPDIRPVTWQKSLVCLGPKYLVPGTGPGEAENAPQTHVEWLEFLALYCVLEALLDAFKKSGERAITESHWIERRALLRIVRMHPPGCCLQSSGSRRGCSPSISAGETRVSDTWRRACKPIA